MKNVKKYIGVKKFILSSFVILCIFGFYLGLNFFKDSHAETNIGGSTAASYYRYVNRHQNNIVVKYTKGGATKRSSKKDIGFMRISVEGNKSNLLHVFCGFRGKTLSQAVNYYRYNFDEFYAGYSEDWRRKLSNIVSLFTPDVTSVETMRSYLATNYPTEYATYGFGNLDQDEILTAMQTAIWVFTNNDSNYVASSGNAARNNRINALHSILLQNNEYLRNVSSSISSINFSLNSDLALNQTTNKYEGSLRVISSTFNQASDQLSLYLSTNAGTIIPSTNYTASYSTSGSYTILNIAFNDGVIFVNSNGKAALAATGEEFNAIYVTASVLHGTSKRNVFVYKSADNYQHFLGAETAPITSTSYISLTAPEVVKVSIEVDKVDEENLSSPSLNHAYLHLYRVEGGSNTLIAEWLSSGTNKVINDLQPGTYKIVETIYPEGYQRSTAATRVDNDNIYVSSGYEFVLTSGHSKFYIHVMNKKTEVKIRKIDTSSSYVKGAIFSIIDSDGGEYYQFESTDDDISIKGELDVGTYFLVEIEAPTNYVKSNKAYRFVVGEALPNDPTTIVDGEYANMPIVDAAYDSSTRTVIITNDFGISISKKSLDDNAVYVIGATLTITNSSNNVIDTWVTTNEDHIITDVLPDGTYKLTETIPAPGYATAETIEFQISNGKVVNNVNINMKDAPLQVCIAKKSTNVSGNIAGAEFELYDSSNKLITKFTSTDEVYCADVSLGLRPGTYTIKETKAPEGYKGISQQKIVIRDTPDLQMFEVLNEVEVPKTALDTSMVIYIAAVIMGIAGIGLVCYYVKRYNY